LRIDDVFSFPIYSLHISADKVLLAYPREGFYYTYRILCVANAVFHDCMFGENTIQNSFTQQLVGLFSYNICSPERNSTLAFIASRSMSEVYRSVHMSSAKISNFSLLIACSYLFQLKPELWWLLVQEMFNICTVCSQLLPLVRQTIAYPTCFLK